MLVSKSLAILVGIELSSFTVNAKEPKYSRVNKKDTAKKDRKKLTPQSIIGGNEIVPYSRPYLVSIGTGTSGYWGQYCGGSLISPHAVLTAASCVTGFAWAPPEWVEFNRHDLFNDTGVIRLKLNDTTQCEGDAVYHPEYDYFTLDNDVAILFLPTPINHIAPVKLNTDASLPAAGDPLDVAGWGYDGYTYPTVPSAVTLNYLTNEACTKKPYRYKDDEITDSMMCAHAEGKSGCSLDRGGPLVLAKDEPEGGPLTPVVQVGILSWGKACADSRFPNVSTRISDVADWVKDTVCARTGELCPNSKSGKNSKTKKVYDKCVKMPTFAPLPTYSPTITASPQTPWPTSSPTITAQPYTPIPTFDVTDWPTWMPTMTPTAKSGK